MLTLRGVIEPLIGRLPYSDLIALAGVCKKIRKWVLASQKWKGILDEWKISAKGLPIINFDMDRNDYQVKRMDGNRIFYISVPGNAENYTLRQVKSRVDGWVFPKTPSDIFSGGGVYK